MVLALLFKLAIMAAMNYFLANLFRDWKWWAQLGVGLVGALNLMDILSATLAYPGFFGLWIVRITAGGGLAGLLAYYLYWKRHDDRIRRIESLLPPLAAERRAYFEKMVAIDPSFQTFCYQCHHYDHNHRCCNLRLQGREVRVKLQPLGTSSYCLYWNLTGHPIMEYTKKLSPR